jgi:4-hydroxybenzoyl-CoA reductase subunit beta
MTMPLPVFEYCTPATAGEAARLLADKEHPSALIGGGTDLLPAMKRRQTTPVALVSLSAIDSLKGIRIEDDGRCTIGASTLLREVEYSTAVPSALASAAGGIASPQIRNTATVGGNLCLDTRCNYIDMPDTWREASGHCLKEGGEVCWVAPKGNRCWAVSSSDLAPLAIALEGEIQLVGATGERSIPAGDLYQDDGIAFQTKTADEILISLTLPADAPRATYRKLRRRGAIDFPILGVAAAGRFDADGTCLWARLVISAVSPAPMRATEAEDFIVGRRLTDEVIEEAARLASVPVRPQDNTDMGSRYRKWMAPVFVNRALRDLEES